MRPIWIAAALLLGLAACTNANAPLPAGSGGGQTVRTAPPG